MYRAQAGAPGSDEDHATPAAPVAPAAPAVEIAIIGAGFSGLGMAMALERAGFEGEYVVLERAQDLGGTWRDNTYPGCACDIPSVLYSWTDAQNPRWSRAFAPQQEILDYIRAVAHERGIERRVRYDSEVTSIVWDADAGRYEFECTNGTRLTAEVVISAAGALADPAIPDLDGLDSFEGRIFHSARWDHEHDLNGRNVAVIGTGASAIQFVPRIQPHVNRLHLFQRTPPWVLPRFDPRVPDRWQRRFERHPRLQHATRTAVFSLLESFHAAFAHPRLMGLSERRARRHIARQVPDPQLREAVTPGYRLGCKRVLASNTWYPSLCADNVDVITNEIDRITTTSIVDAAGIEHETDTIIFGTGFHVTDPPIAHRITGAHGATLAETWEGSPKAHLGLAVAGFPNFFMLLGPNTGLGHNSVLLMIEAQVTHVLKALEHRRRGGLRATLEPRAAAQAQFIEDLDAQTRGSVWTAGGCVSWYLDATGRNSALWPGTVRAYQRRVRNFDPRDYAVTRPTHRPTRPTRERISA